MGNRSLSRDVLTCLAIAALTFIAFAPVRDFDFVTYDDLEFVAENPHVATGLSWPNIRWAFANAYDATGGPVTWLSHMLDAELFDLDAGAHHVTSLIIHIGNSLLLFALWQRMTGAAGPSALVAALFAIHPLHVESVAWIAERKDVLSTFFWLATTWLYVSYVRRPSLGRYAWIVAALTLGLMSKPMLATLPFTLLLLDSWPLRRLPPDRTFWQRSGALIREKVPLFLLAAASMGFVLLAQRQIGAVASFDQLPLGSRISNAVISYVAYLGKMFWPSGLAPFYPYRQALPFPIVAACAAVLLAMTAAALLAARRAPYLTVGWLWYVGTLVPVIGIVQIGGHAMADRFTYVPLIGLFVAIGWGLSELRLLFPAGLAAVLLCAGLTRAQAMHWENGVALWEHAVRVTHDNARAHANLGVSYARLGRRTEAVAAYREALRLEPRYAEAHHNLALALAEDHQPTEALTHYREALRLKPAYANAHMNLANLLDDSGSRSEAIAHYEEALRLQPANVLAHMNLAIALAKDERRAEAIAHVREAIRLDPRNVQWQEVLAALQR